MKKGNLILHTALSLLLCAGLAAQSIQVLSPNGGERLALDAPTAITWTATDFNGYLRIILFRGGTEAADRVGAIAENVPSAAGSFSWTAGALLDAAPAPAGDGYYIRIRAVTGGGVVDHNDAPFSLYSTRPNIRCRSMHAIGHSHTFLPATFTAGDTVTISYYLDNNSPYSAGPFNVGLRVGGVIVARNAVPELESGGEASGDFVWTATCGSRVEVVADCDNAVTESNESDNAWSDPGLACSQPNLSIFRAEFSGSDPARVSADMNYQFNGEILASTATCRDVRITAGVVGGAVLVDRTIPVMNPGDRESVEFIWQVPAGSSRVYIQADPDDTIVESNEGDNRWEVALTGVVLDHSTEHYDLSVAITRSSLPAAAAKLPTLTRGESVTIRGSIRGATGAIRAVRVLAQAKYADGHIVRFYSNTISHISTAVVPFSFPWTPSRSGIATLFVSVSPGPHAVSVGVTDAEPSNNTDSIKVRVVEPLRRIIRR